MYKKYLYLDGQKETPIMVYAKRRPSAKTMPKSGTWVVREYERGYGWSIPCFPEILWERLKVMKFIGIIKRNK